MIELDEVKQRVDNWKQGYWEIPDNLDVSDFEFEWRPDPYDRPFIHQFGTQWQKTGGPRFIVPGHNNQIKYQDCQKAIRKPDINNRAWRPLLANCTIDHSWHPDENDPPYIYVFGNQWYDVDTMPTYQYRVKGATEKKFVYDVTAKLLPVKERWEIPEDISEDFDYSWVPHPHEPPMIWEFGTQWQKNGGPKYIATKGADVKFTNIQIATKLDSRDTNRAWRLLKPVDHFDFSWHPDVNDPPYNYVFGNQWYGPEIMPTVMYRVKGATETKYVHDIKAHLGQDFENYEAILNRKMTFDFTWVPDPTDPPYIYVFGSQHHSAIDLPVLMYKVDGATSVKYVDDIKVTLLPDRTDWEVPFNIDDSDFDYSWHPSIHEEPCVFQFGTQWQKTGGPRFIYKNGTQVKYVDFMRVTKIANPDNRAWRVLKNVEFDYSWHPDDSEPAYNYVFGNQWHSAERMPTVIYRVKGATENKYIDTLKAKLLLDQSNFEKLTDLEFDFDYSWCPDPFDPPFTYVFGNQWHDSKTMPTLMYVMKGATTTKYVDDIVATLKPNKSNWIIPANIDDSMFDYSWVPNPHSPDMIYQFGTQWQKTGGPQYIAGNSYDVKYVDFQRVTKLPEVNRNFRPVVSNIDFDYSWHPDSSDPPYNYVFGNQWHDATVMPTMMYRVKGASENKYITNTIATLLPNKDNWVIPDDVDDSMFDYSWVPNPHEPPMIYQFGTQWQRTGGPKYVVENATEIKYVDTQTVKKLPNIRNWRILEQMDMDTFDFSWHPDDTECNFTYVFGNKFHSPEIMPTLMYKSGQSMGNKYAADLKADLKVSVIQYEDSIFDALMDNKFDTAYAHFVKNDEPLSHEILATKEVSVHLLGNQAIVPKVSKIYMYDKITDYDHVVKHNVDTKIELLDIIFISNGEACADSNLDYLLSLNLPNRIVHIKGIDGRVASQHAAANASNTPWYFLINAKLRVNKDFDFSWQPNIYKSRRHYIFTATNPVNGLEYGHQAIVANNKKLTLSTVVRGLDYTMDSRHEVVEMNSGVGLYNSSEWDTYRTAFRECIKLKHNKDVESKKRLDVWLTVANGDFAQYSLQGAKDAINYYESVNGDLEKLKLSYDWAWIKDKFNK